MQACRLAGGYVALQLLRQATLSLGARSTIQPWLARRLLAIIGIVPCYSINHYGDDDDGDDDDNDDDLGARSTGRAYRWSLPGG